VKKESYIMSIAIKPRTEIQDQYKWNAPSVFADEAGWHAAFDETRATLPTLKEYAGRLSESPETLLEFLQLAEGVERQLYKLYVYAGMNQAVDASDNVAAGMIGQVMGLAAAAGAATAFRDPELLALGEETLMQWADEHAGLAVYRQMFDDLLRQKPHVRSAEVEEILGMLSEPFSSANRTSDRLTGADMKFAPAVDSEGNEHTLAQSSMDGLKKVADRETRRTAWNNYADQYLAHKHTLTNAYLTSVKQQIFQARVRGYESVLHMRLSAHNIDVAVFHNLLETYKKHLPIWHRYWRIRREMLGVETLHPYDIWAPLTPNQPHVPYEQAVDWIASGLQPLGDDYVSAMRRGCLEQRWVDVYPNEGKREGAFSSGSYDTHPFIMMSYTDELSSMSTLAHELGHSMHSYLSRSTQPFVYSGYSLFLAEIASNFNQAMTRAHLFGENDAPDFQIALVEEAMENFHRYFFIMPTLSRFEYEVFERTSAGESLSADDLINLMTRLFEEGYGGEMHIDHERVGITWAQFGHLYVPFYTFQYATGISGAHAFARRILDGQEGAVESYLGFLQAGSSDYPMNVLHTAGLDLSQPAPVEQAFGELEKLVDRLESLAE
jgi:oligoendopeptidase F